MRRFRFPKYLSRSAAVIACGVLPGCALILGIEKAEVDESFDPDNPDGDTTGDGDGDTVSGDGDTVVGDGDTVVGDGDTVVGDGDTVVGDGDTTAGDGDTVVGDGDGTGGSGTIELYPGVTIEAAGCGEEVSLGLGFTQEELNHCMLLVECGVIDDMTIADCLLAAPIDFPIVDPALAVSYACTTEYGCSEFAACMQFAMSEWVYLYPPNFEYCDSSGVFCEGDLVTQCLEPGVTKGSVDCGRIGLTCQETTNVDCRTSTCEPNTECVPGCSLFGDVAHICLGGAGVDIECLLTNGGCTDSPYFFTTGFSTPTCQTLGVGF